MSSLFRPEALAAQHAQWLGTIRLAQPVGRFAATAVAVAIAALVVAFVALGHYTRRATVVGHLEPRGGTVRLTAPAAGSIVAAPAREALEVAAGEPLFTLSAERRSTTGLTQALFGDRIEARRSTLDGDRRRIETRHETRTRAARERVAAIDAEVARLDREAAIVDARRAIARKNVERFDELARTGFVAVAQAQARLDDALVVDAQAEGYARLKGGLARERIGLVAQVDESRLAAEAERAELARAVAALDAERAENDARTTTVVAAPFAGHVTGLAARPGQWVAAGGLLATLIAADAPLEAQLFATTRQVGFVAVGQRVRLRYAAYPYQKFGFGEGTVASVEASPYAPQELASRIAGAIVGATHGEPVYRVVVALDAQAVAGQRLKAGMVVEGDVLLDRRQLYEWLLEPLFGVAQR